MKVIITGTTGMVGEGVLHTCLNSPLIESALSVSRKPAGFENPKLKELIIDDFFKLSGYEEILCGYDACFFCLGISSVGVNKAVYYKTTYELTMNFGRLLSGLNKEMVFIYVSGAGTDSTENGRLEWAREKGKTENDLMKLPFKKVYAYRPGFIKPIDGLKKAHKFYEYINWFYPAGKALFPENFNTLEEVGLSMINISKTNYDKKVITGKDITLLARY